MPPNTAPATSPLALIQVVDIVKQGITNFKELSSFHADDAVNLEYLNLGVRSIPNQIIEKLSDIWALERFDHGKPLLDVITFLNPDCIQEPMLKNEKGGLSETYPFLESDYASERDEILGSSLISYDSSEKRLSVHPIVQNIVRSRMRLSRYHTAFSAALGLVTSSWPFEDFGWSYDTDRWNTYERLLPHVLQLRKVADGVFLSLKGIDSQIEYCRLTYDAGRYCLEKGAISMSKDLIQHALRIVRDCERSKLSEMALEQYDTITADTHYYLGCIYAECNWREDCKHHFGRFNSTLLSRSAGFRESNGRMVRAEYAVGMCCIIDGMWKLVPQVFKRSIEVAHSKKVFDRVDLASSYINLGLVYCLEDRFDEAHKTLFEGLHKLCDVSGFLDRKFYYIASRFNYAIGDVQEFQGRIDLSLSNYKEALYRCLRSLGELHYQTGDVHVRLAGHHLRSRDFEEAGNHIDMAMNIFNQDVNFLPRKTRALFRKSAILQAAGKATEALSCRQESLSMYHKVTGCEAGDNMTDADFDALVPIWSR